MPRVLCYTSTSIRPQYIYIYIFLFKCCTLKKCMLCKTSPWQLPVYPTVQVVTQNVKSRWVETKWFASTWNHSSWCQSRWVSDSDLGNSLVVTSWLALARLGRMNSTQATMCECTDKLEGLCPISSHSHKHCHISIYCHVAPLPWPWARWQIGTWMSSSTPIPATLNFRVGSGQVTPAV